MTDRFTAITFAPVQGFIEKSRKLRDLYGSSLILSYLATQVCDAARQYLKSTDPQAGSSNDPIIMPASIKATRGTPNQILIRGEFPKAEAKKAFDKAWQILCDACRQWIEANVQRSEDGFWQYQWQRPWQQWNNHAWEFFWAVGESPDEAKRLLMGRKAARAWTGVNWVGESSTLSGADSRAWPLLGRHSPHSRARGEEDAEVRAFYQQLSNAIGNNRTGEAIITPREQLSIPELVKRLVTVDQVIGPNIQIDSPLRTFKALNRWGEEKVPGEAQRQSEDDTTERWTGWFQGDGDQVGDYLRGQTPEELHNFSYRLREWGERLQHQLPKSEKDRKTRDRDGRVIYAGGDDFLGVLYRNPPDPPLAPKECVDWFSIFKSDVWQQHQQPISVSVGFVWAAPKVPQRDVLQHCREAQESAKDQGRDRIAFRILFNGGNYLEWVCPWWLLEAGLLEQYRDRNGDQGDAANWTHIFTDVATLESRHGFAGNQNEVALSLLQIYFDDDGKDTLRRTIETHRWDVPAEKRTGILGNRPEDVTDPIAALNQWIINLAKVGFHLCSKS